MEGLSFTVKGLRFRFEGSRFRVEGIRFRVEGLRFRAEGLRFRVESLGTCPSNLPAAAPASVQGFLTHKKHAEYEVKPVPPSPCLQGTSHVRNTSLLGPYSRTLPRVLWRSCGGGCFL